LDWLVLSAFFLSGAAALGLEIIWLRLLGLVFGSESMGVLGVLAGFFGGLAVGSLIVHGWLARSRAPILVYAASEAVIAAYAVVSPALLVGAGDTLTHLVAPVVGDNQSFGALVVNLSVGGLLVLPATACMGATVPAMVEAWRRVRPPDANRYTVGQLYAANTLGAMLGIAFTTYWLLPRVGVQPAALVLGVTSGAAALLAWVWHRSFRGRHDVAGHVAARSKKAPAIDDQQPRAQLHLFLFCTGVAGIGLEVVGTYVLAQVFQDTVFTFANILAVYLAGTALGGWLYTRPRFHGLMTDYHKARRVLLGGLALSTVIAGHVLAYVPALVQRVAPAGATHVPQVTAEIAATAFSLFLPTLWMGAVFSHLVGFFTPSGVGRAYAINTLGAAVAPFVVGLGLIPSFGPTVAFHVVAALYLGLFAFDSLAGRRESWSVALLAAGIVLALAVPSLVLIRFPAGITPVAQAVGSYGVVSVTEPVGRGSTTEVRVLQVNQHFVMGGAQGFVEKRMGHLPLLFANRGENVLYLGVGTGITAGAAVATGAERITAVELVPEIIDLLPWFAAQNARLHLDPRVQLHVSDARRFLRATRATYDVIVADLFHPSRDGAGFLYTREHFLAARTRLAADGLFVQWLALHQLSPRDFQTIVRTFLDVFPRAHGVLANYTGDAAAFGLFGWADDRPGLQLGLLRERLNPSTEAGRIFDGVTDVLGAYMTDSNALRKFAGAGSLNTDLTQRILFDAARNPDAQSDSRRRWQALASVLPYRHSFPDSLILGASSEELASLRRETEPFSRTVTHYLNGEVLRLSAGDAVTTERAIREYLTAFAMTPGFAQDQLIELCFAYPQAAHDIISTMAAARPDQPRLGVLEKQLAGVRDEREVRAILFNFVRAGA
jgi:spermidine synthase